MCHDLPVRGFGRRGARMGSMQQTKGSVMSLPSHVAMARLFVCMHRPVPQHAGGPCFINTPSARKEEAGKRSCKDRWVRTDRGWEATDWTPCRGEQRAMPRVQYTPVFPLRTRRARAQAWRPAPGSPRLGAAVAAVATARPTPHRQQGVWQKAWRRKWQPRAIKALQTQLGRAAGHPSVVVLPAPRRAQRGDGDCRAQEMQRFFGHRLQQLLLPHGFRVAISAHPPWRAFVTVAPFVAASAATQAAAAHKDAWLSRAHALRQRRAASAFRIVARRSRGGSEADANDDEGWVEEALL